MSIESSLVKLADKIDAQGASDVVPDYKNPNNSIEKSIDRIADHYEGGGSGGGTGSGVLVVHSTNGTLDKTWKEIHDAMGTSLAILLADSEYNGFTVSVGCEADWEGGDYWIGFGDFHANVTIFLTDSEYGYPQAQI